MHDVEVEQDRRSNEQISVGRSADRLNRVRDILFLENHHKGVSLRTSKGQIKNRDVPSITSGIR